MIKNYLVYPIQLIILILVQVILLNNIQFSGFINPFLYIIFILWLPISTPKWLLLSLSFFVGICVDVFSNTLGMHASASLFLAFCRPYILNILAPRDGYEANQQPGYQDFGFIWFISYAAILTLLHHTFLFFVEVFRFSDFFSTLGRILASTFFTLLLIGITQLFKYNSEAR